jgi:hypothetical protein
MPLYNHFISTGKEKIHLLSTKLRLHPDGQTVFPYYQLGDGGALEETF